MAMNNKGKHARMSHACVPAAYTQKWCMRVACATVAYLCTALYIQVETQHCHLMVKNNISVNRDYFTHYNISLHIYKHISNYFIAMLVKITFVKFFSSFIVRL